MTLPAPPEWRRKRLLLAGGVVMTISNVVISISALLEGSWGTALFGALGAMFFGSIVVLFARALSGDVIVRVDWDEKGSVVREDPVCVFFMGLTLCALFVLGLVLLMTSAGMIDDEFVRGGRGSALVVGILVLFGAIWSGTWVARVGLPRVVLSPTGVAVYSPSGVRSLAWNGVTEIVAGPSGRRDSGSSITVTGMSGRPVVVSSARNYVPGGAALYWMLRYYWRHPECRDELTTSRAGERLVAGDFPVD